MAVVDPESKRAGIEKLVKAGVLVVGLAVAAPLLYSALEGALYAGALGLVALVAWGIGPSLAQAVANWRIAALKAVIAANPIETMQNLYADKVHEYDEREKAVEEFDTQFQNVSQMVEGLKKTDPEEATQYVEMRDKMKEGLEELRVELRSAKTELDNTDKAIKKMQRIWNVACAMNKALAASASAQKQVFDQMRVDVSVETVQTNLNRAFARLNTAVERRKTGGFLPVKEEPKQLEAAKVEVIDLGNVKTPSKVRV